MDNRLSTANKTVEISPARMIQWTVDKMVSRTSVHLQGLMYAQNLLPEQLESLYIVHLNELNTYSRVRNIAELYGEADDVSSLKYASYNPEHFLNSVTKHILRLTGEHNIEIFSSCDIRIKSAVFDLRRTSLILYNLISNSIMHTKLKQKVIEIRAFMRNNNFVISVKDNGRGISAEKHRNLFYAFENKPVLKSADLTDIGLSLGGLGLSVCRKAARDMGGDVTYVSSMDRGNEFELTIPQSGRKIDFGETVLAEPDTDELKICLAGAILSLLVKNPHLTEQA